MSANGDGADLADEGPPTRDLAVPLEDVAEVETLWLGLDGRGAYTLVAWADPEAERDMAFLGEGGRLHAAGEVPGLRAYLASGHAPPMAGVDDWDDLVEDADALDLEPYEDNVVDLDALGALIGPDLSGPDAQRLLDGQGLLVDLGTWLGVDEVVGALGQDTTLGHFLAGVLPDLVTGSHVGALRLGESDLDAVRDEWVLLVHRVAELVDWVDA